MNASWSVISQSRWARVEPTPWPASKSTLRSTGRLLEVAASSRAAIEAATDAVRSAKEARRVLGDRFAAGVATSTDVLDAQVALLQADLDRTQAIANAHLADARLARALGK